MGEFNLSVKGDGLYYKKEEKERSPVQRGVIKPRRFIVKREAVNDAREIRWKIFDKQKDWLIGEAYSRKDAYDITRALNERAI